MFVKNDEFSKKRNIFFRIFLYCLERIFEIRGDFSGKYLVIFHKKCYNNYIYVTVLS